jgi:hypothetical protein
MWGKLGLPLFKLNGYRGCMITALTCIPHKGRLASMDESGRILLWDSRRYVKRVCQKKCKHIVLKYVVITSLQLLVAD